MLDNDDEFFYVIEGQLLIDLQDRVVSLDPRQGFVVPKGVLHRTRAPQRTVVLMVENAGIIPPATNPSSPRTPNLPGSAGCQPAQDNLSPFREPFSHSNYAGIIPTGN